ncbi:uncharacterized protein ARMOST_19737 [Armillaria ostoyae]|uniref:F-box domain-containing protein n=1 Tax=Armillaria ostoyae TaxID=47428 RepID=A0A284S5D5_ARMOS|nr:uncharacterized protein ARMOST_19737 [Armillaria ostoyae]
MTNLDIVDDDVMSVILSFVEPDVLQPSLYLVARSLKALASVSWRFRRLCLPWLYRDVAWFWKDVDGHFQFIPESLWIYVRKFRLTGSSRRYPHIPRRRDVFLDSEHLASRVLAEQLAVAIPRMTGLREFCFDLEATYWPGPWQSLLESIALSRTLESLEINGQWRCQWEALLPLSMNQVPIRRFRYLPYLSTLSRLDHQVAVQGMRDVEERQVEAHNLRLLLSSFCETLNILEIPAELANDLSLSFPSLTELTMCGHSPLPVLSSSLWSEIVPEATLRVLDFGVVRSSGAHMSSGQVSLLARNLSHLHTLILSNALPNDAIFRALPSELSHLSLNPYPLPYPRPEARIPVKIMPGAALVRILTIGKFANLKTLSISYRWDSNESDISLINSLHDICPQLVHLEFSRYGTQPGGDPLDVLILLQTSLRRSVHLRTLRLNLENAPASLSLFESLHANDRSAKRHSLLRDIAIGSTRLHSISYLLLDFPFKCSFDWVWVTWDVRDNDSVRLNF